MTDFRVDGGLGLDVAAFVRSVQEARTELQGMKDDVEELNRQLRELENKTVKVKVEIDGAAEIRQLRDDLDRLSRETVNIRVEVDFDDLSVRSARLDLAQLRADFGDIRINATVEVDGMAEVDRLYLRLQELTAHRWTINIDIDGIAEATAQLAALRLELDGVSGSLGGMGGAADGAAAGAGGAGGGLGGMVGIILTLLPLLVTLGGVLAGVGAGLIGSFATAAIGVGAFAAFAIPTITAVTTASTELAAAQTAVDQATTQSQLVSALQKQQDILASLSPEMRIAVTNLNDLKQTFKDMQKEIEPIALDAFAEGLNFARAGLEDIFPVAKAAGGAITNLLADAAEGLKGNDWTKFFKYVTDNTAYFITTWGHAVGNFITGIANMIKAFDPLSKFVSKGFLGMSDSFLKWTEGLQNNKAYQDFVDYVMTNGPIVLDLVDNLFSALIQLTMALAPIGALMLPIVTNLVTMAAAFIKSNPQWATWLAILIPLIGAAITLWPLLSGIAGALGAIISPAGAVVLAVVALIAVMVLWYENFQSFRDFVNEVWTRIQGYFSSGIKFIRDSVNEFLPALLQLWEKYGKGISDYVLGMMTVISGAIKGAMYLIRGIINIVLGLLTGDWSRVWKGMKQIVTGAWTTISSIVKGGSQALLGLLRTLLTGIGNVFKGIGGLLYNAGKALIKGFGQGIADMAGWAKDKAEGVLSGIKDLFPNSPAKEGPFSGKGYTLYSGQAVMEDWGQGFLSRKDYVKSAAADVMSAASGVVNMSITAGNGSATPKQGSSGYISASMATGQSIVFSEGAFQINNPAAETPSDSVNRTMTRVSRFGLFQGTSS